jgi:hypothetical protein
MMVNREEHRNNATVGTHEDLKYWFNSKNEITLASVDLHSRGGTDSKVVDPRFHRGSPTAMAQAMHKRNS